MLINQISYSSISYIKPKEVINIPKRIVYVIFICIVIMIMPLNPAIAETGNENFQEYGFSGDLVEWVSNDRDYEWYEDQGTTGYLGYNNCGASVATMATKWYDESFTKTGEDARNTYFLNGGWWYTTTIVQYLTDNKVANYYDYYNYDKEQIKKIINDQKIFILCIDGFYLDYSTDCMSVIGRFYSPSTGHFILIKGYVETTDNFYLETYDPYSMGQIGINEEYSGKIRYYTLNNINEAVKNRWEYMIVISKE